MKLRKLIADIICKFFCIDEFQIAIKIPPMALGCWGEDSDHLRLNVSANRFEAGPNPASRFFSSSSIVLFRVIRLLASPINKKRHG